MRNRLRRLREWFARAQPFQSPMHVLDPQRRRRRLAFLPRRAVGQLGLARSREPHCARSQDYNPELMSNASPEAARNSAAPTEAPRAERRPHVVESTASRSTTPMRGSRPRTGRRRSAIRRCCRPTSARYLEAENAYARSVLAPLDDAEGRTSSPRCAGASRRTIRASPVRDGPSTIGRAHREGGQHPLVCRRPARRAATRRKRSCSTATRWREGHAFFQLGGVAHVARPRAARLERRRRGLRVLHHPGPRPRDRRRPAPTRFPTRPARRSGRRRQRASGTCGSTRNTARSKCIGTCLGDRSGGDTLRLSGSRIPAGSSGRGDAVRRLLRHPVSDHDTSEALLIDRAAPDGRAAPRVRRAQAGVRYDVEHHPDLDGRSSLDHPHQRGRRRWTSS